jgi:predicted  nucleic acid-binding Zn-ribbon protein
MTKDQRNRIADEVTHTAVEDIRLRLARLYPGGRTTPAERTAVERQVAAQLLTGRRSMPIEDSERMALAALDADDLERDHDNPEPEPLMVNPTVYPTLESRVDVLVGRLDDLVRSDERMSQRMSALEQSQSERLERLKGYIGNLADRTEALEQRVVAWGSDRAEVDSAITHLTKRLDAHNHRLNQLETEHIEARRPDTLTSRVDALAVMTSDLDAQVDGLAERSNAEDSAISTLAQRLGKHAQRLDGLEERETSLTVSLGALERRFDHHLAHQPPGYGRHIDTRP